MKNPNVLAQKKRERKSSETELISWTDSRLDGSLIIRHLHLSQFHQWTETAKIRWPQQSSDRSKNAIKSSTNEDKSIWEVWKLFSSKQVGFYNWAKKKTSETRANHKPSLETWHVIRHLQYIRFPHRVYQDPKYEVTRTKRRAGNSNLSDK